MREKKKNVSQSKLIDKLKNIYHLY